LNNIYDGSPPITPAVEYRQ